MAESPLVAVHRAAAASLTVIDDVEVAARYPGALDAPLASTDVVCADLAHRPVFQLVGDDVRRWTNGMFTNNTRALQVGRGNRHCACDDRGRVQGVLDLYLVAEDTVRIVLDGMTRDAFESRYRMYLMLDDIELDNESPERTVLTVQGAAAAQHLEALGLPVPAVDYAHLDATGDFSGVTVARRDRIGRGGFDLFVPAHLAASVWAALTHRGVRALGVADLDALRVLAGQAAFPTDASDKSMVHELALDKACCSFNKGCYVGQEVINRIDVKGAIQKRLTGVVLDGAVPVGAKVMLGDKAVGTLTSRATLWGRELGLGVLRKAVWEAGTEVQVDDGTGGVVRGVVTTAPLVG